MADSIIADIDHLLNLAFPFLQRFSHFIGDQRPECVLMLSQAQADLAYNLTSLRRRNRPPAGGPTRRNPRSIEVSDTNRDRTPCGGTDQDEGRPEGRPSLLPIDLNYE